MRKSITLLLWMLLLYCACPEQSAENAFRRGLDLEYKGRYEDAESQFLAVVRELAESQAPEEVNLRVRALIAAARLENLYLNDPRRAVARLREALRNAVDSEQAFEVQQEIATIFLDRLSDCRNAVPEIERLVVAFPEKDGIEQWRYRLAQCHFTMEQFEQARAEARMLLEKHPENQLSMEAHLLVANSYFLEKRYREALEAHQQILNLDPQPQQQARSLFEQGLCYEQLGDLEKAELVFLNALKNHPRPDVVKEKLLALRKRMLEMPRPGSQEQKNQPAQNAPVAPAAKVSLQPKAEQKPEAKTAPAKAAPAADPAEGEKQATTPQKKAEAPDKNASGSKPPADATKPPEPETGGGGQP